MKSRRSELRHVEVFDDSVTKYMKESDDLMYRNFNDEENATIRY